MRKFLMVVAVGALALLVAAPVMAVDFKFGAEYRVRFYDYANVGFNDTPGTNPRGVQIRVRPRFDASDDNGNITATWRAEYGDTEFGGGGGANGVANGANSIGNLQSFTLTNGQNRVRNGGGGAIGNDGVALETKWAYMDFALPFGVPLRVRAGLQPWYLPKGLIIDDDVAGVRMYGTVAPFSYEAAWFRAQRGSTVAGITQFTSSGVVVTKDNAMDFYQFKFDLALSKAFNGGLYYVYGDNRANCDFPGVAVAGGNGTGPNNISCATNDRVRPQHWLGVTTSGDVGFMSYDLDFVYGYAKGGPTGGLLNANGQVVKVTGYVFDGGVHFPIGPVRLNIVGSYASGDKGDSTQTTSKAFPGGIGPSWNGPSQVAGGTYELIGAAGSFDVVDASQDSPTNLWTIGMSAEYNPVKALTLRLHYLYAGFSKKHGNCVNEPAFTGTTTVGCFGPQYQSLAGKSSLGQEVGFRADYQVWTGFKLQGFAGWLFPPGDGSPLGKYILQMLYNF
jgi:hypothetical protein